MIVQSDLSASRSRRLSPGLHKQDILLRCCNIINRPGTVATGCDVAALLTGPVHQLPAVM